MMGLPSSDDVRTRMVEIARGFVGADATGAAYRELIAPSHIEFAAKGMLAMSGCALVVRGMWRLLGVDSEILRKPYRIGRAVSDVVEIAHAHQAWIEAPPYGDAVPGLGDVVLVGGPGHGGVEHVYVVTSIVEDGGNHLTMTSVDGGQRTKTGHQCIAARARVWQPCGATTADTAIDVVGATTRTVRGWADVERLAACGEVTGSSNM